MDYQEAIDTLREDIRCVCYREQKLCGICVTHSLIERDNIIAACKTAISAMQWLQTLHNQGFSPERLKNIDFRKEVVEHINYDAYMSLMDELEEYREIGTLEEVRESIQELQMYKDSKLVLIPDAVHKKQCEELDKYKQLGTLEELKKLKECELSGVELAEIACSINLLKDYQKLGTLEQVREAVEKQKAKKPLLGGNTDKLTGDIRICPCCCGIVGMDDMRADYCADCGQHIDWSEVEE